MHIMGFLGQNNIHIFALVGIFMDCNKSDFFRIYVFANVCNNMTLSFRHGILASSLKKTAYQHFMLTTLEYSVEMRNTSMQQSITKNSLSKVNDFDALRQFLGIDIICNDNKCIIIDNSTFDS